MSTPLYPTFEKRIDDAVAYIVNEHVEPWFFIPQRFTVRRFDGRQISYEGIEFEGTPRLVFWSRYMQPFLEDLVVKEFSAARSAAKDRHVDARLLIPEVQSLLGYGCRSVLNRMAAVDHRHLGKDSIHQVLLRSVESEHAVMREFIEKHAIAELQIVETKTVVRTVV